jgi:cytochrome P450
MPAVERGDDLVGEVTTSFDHHDRELMVDPYSLYATLRQTCPVAHTEAHGGFWILSRYREVYAAEHDWQTFSATGGMSIPSLLEVGAPQQVPLECDPPEHTKYRSALNQQFTPQAIALLEPQIQEIATDLVDQFIERGNADLAQDLAAPLPAIVILRLLGLDREAEGQIRAWIDTVIRHRDDFASAALAGQALYCYLQTVLDERRAQPPLDDLIGLLLAATPEGQPLEDDVIIRIVFLLILGGLETTAGVIATTFLHMIEQPETRKALLEAPELLPSAVEEFLRLISPVQGLARTATCDAEVGGLAIKKGERIFLSYASANRDEEEFPNADVCLLDRTPNRHMAFGSGIHRCVGAHLGRLEFVVAMREVLERLPDFQLAEGAEIRWAVGGESRGVSSLPVVFTPGTKRH